RRSYLRGMGPLALRTFAAVFARRTLSTCKELWNRIGSREILVQGVCRSIYRRSIMANRSNRDSDLASPALELNPADVDRSASLRDQIYELLRMRIVVGVMRPGQVVNEIEIATQLGLSRTPVREAVKRISDEGLIVIRAQNGTFVADFSR